MAESRQPHRPRREAPRRKREGSMARTKARPQSAGLRASVIRLGTAGVELARDAAWRLAVGALDASAEARRQAEELLRRLRGTITDRFGVASRTELTDLRGRIAALDRRLEELREQGDEDDSRGRF